jgi:hypothetical protein
MFAGSVLSVERFGKDDYRPHAFELQDRALPGATD